MASQAQLPNTLTALTAPSVTHLESMPVAAQAKVGEHPVWQEVTPAFTSITSLITPEGEYRSSAPITWSDYQQGRLLPLLPKQNPLTCLAAALGGRRPWDPLPKGTTDTLSFLPCSSTSWGKDAAPRSCAPV